MKRNNVPLIICIVLVVICVICSISVYGVRYFLYMSKVDVEYVEILENALNNYDIDALNEVIADNANIIYRDKEDIYSNLRKNIEQNMTDKNYTITIYGGVDKFENSVQIIGAQAYGYFEGVNLGEGYIKIKLKRVGFFDFEIVGLESDDLILKKLFFEK